MKQAVSKSLNKILYIYASCWFLVRLTLQPEDGGDMILDILHGVISQKIELFITIAVRTSNSTDV
jgi:hypothetical protein